MNTEKGQTDLNNLIRYCNHRLGAELTLRNKNIFVALATEFSQFSKL